MYKKKMTPMEMDAIGEILNISLGSSATAASTMLNARVDITTPVVQVKNKDEFEFSNLEPAVGVEITYVEGLTGSNVMLLKRTAVSYTHLDVYKRQDSDAADNTGNRERHTA